MFQSLASPSLGFHQALHCKQSSQLEFFQLSCFSGFRTFVDSNAISEAHAITFVKTFWQNIKLFCLSNVSRSDMTCNGISFRRKSAQTLREKKKNALHGSDDPNFIESSNHESCRLIIFIFHLQFAILLQIIDICKSGLISQLLLKFQTVGTKLQIPFEFYKKYYRKV